MESSVFHPPEQSMMEYMATIFFFSWIYFAEYETGRIKGRIMKAQMNGEHKFVLVSTNVVAPTGIALDQQGTYI